jgi:hypothetical protein
MFYGFTKTWSKYILPVVYPLIDKRFGRVKFIIYIYIIIIICLSGEMTFCGSMKRVRLNYKSQAEDYDRLMSNSQSRPISSPCPHRNNVGVCAWVFFFFFFFIYNNYYFMTAQTPLYVVVKLLASAATSLWFHKS